MKLLAEEWDIVFWGRRLTIMDGRHIMSMHKSSRKLCDEEEAKARFQQRELAGGASQCGQLRFRLGAASDELDGCAR